MPQNQPLSAPEIGARIRYAREQSGRSQQDIAKQLGISQNSVQKIENGKVGRSRYISRMWELLGLDLKELNPTLKNSQPPHPLGNFKVEPWYALSGGVMIKRATVAEREAELVRAGYELGRRMERLTAAKEVELAVVEPENGGEFEVGMRFIRADDSSVPFAISLSVARSLGERLHQLIEQIEALKRQTNRHE